MSFYKVVGYPNSVYFVDNQTIVDENTHITCQVGGLSEANVLLAQKQTELLQTNKDLFTVVREETVGENAIWHPVVDIDLENESVFYVFNPLTGQHEQALNKQAAKEKLLEIQQQFLAHHFIDKVETIEALPKASPFDGAGTIPLGVM